MTKTRMRLLAAECPTVDRSSPQWYEETVWYAARLHYEAALTDDALRGALLDTLDDADAIFEVDPALEAADPDAYDEVHSLGLTLYQAVNAIEYAARGCEHDRSPASNRLPTDVVVEIRERYAAGGVSQRDLAAEYGVTSSKVNNLVTGKTYTNAPGPITRDGTGGTRNGHAKLTETEVAEIRERRAAGGTTYTKLSNEFGIAISTVYKIVTGDTWADAPGPIKGVDYDDPGEVAR